MAHDAFICHASEDKDAIARPLAEALRRQNIDVWYDEFSLNVGDSLRESIDRGLASSRYAIVIISPHFFSKPWANRELNGVVARETTQGKRLILPVWHNVDAPDVVNFSPPLADIRAANSSIGIEKLASVISQSIRPDEQPLPVARTELERFGREPPPFSDAWWLDTTTLANDIAHGMFSFAFQFPPRHADERTPRQRGENIAWAALQAGWWDEAEERKICQVTHPDVVLDFVRGIPELHDACRSNPDHFAAYVPQLLVPEFSAEFSQSFDLLLAESEAAFSRSDSQLSRSDEGAACDPRLAFRHPTLGNHRPTRIVDKWLHGHKSQYNAEVLPRIDYLFWLLSDDCAWMPSHITQTLIAGMHETPHWWFDFAQLKWPEPLAKAFYAKRRTPIKWTKALIRDLTFVAEESKQRTNLTSDAKRLAERFIEKDFIGGMDRWHQQVESRRRGKK